MALEKRGKPTVTICTNRFEFLARATSVALGINDPHLVVVTHPIGGIGQEEVIRKADSIINNVVGQ